METVERFNVGTLRVSLYHDPDPESPREWDNLGTVRIWHRRRTFGDAPDPNAPESPEAFAEWLAESGAVYLPVYAYEHSGITISTGAFACPWDSGQVGYVYVLPTKLRAEYGPVEWASDTNREQAFSCLRGEVATLDQYLRGEVYGFVVERFPTCPRDDCAEGSPCLACKAEAEHVGSCWGFYSLDDARGDARAEAEAAAAEVR